MTEAAAIYAVGGKEAKGSQDMQQIMLRKYLGSMVTVHLTNGVRLIGKLTAHDRYTVVLNGTTLIFKHAITTIQQGAPQQHRGGRDEGKRA